jgi:hypothetical protein
MHEKLLDPNHPQNQKQKRKEESRMRKVTVVGVDIAPPGVDMVPRF